MKQQIALLAMIAVISIGIGFISYRRSSDPMQSLLSPAGEVEPTPTPSPTPEPSYSILLLGRGGAGHDGGALTDTVLLVKVLFASKRVVTFSLPRDLWVTIPYDGGAGVDGKLNYAYAIGLSGAGHNGREKLPRYTGIDGGGTLAKDVVQTVTGVVPDRYITLDFSGFEQAIDAIGGVEVTVSPSLTDTEYPIAGRERMICADPTTGPSTPEGVVTVEDAIAKGLVDPLKLSKLSQEFPCRYEYLRFEEGKQVLSGKLALKYVRSRHSLEDGSDFGRSRRQRQVIESATARILTQNPLVTIPKIYAALRSHMETDISASELVGWIPKLVEIRGYPVTQRSLTTNNYLQEGYSPDRQYVLLPVEGRGNWSAIQNWVAATLDPGVFMKNPVVLIQGKMSSAEKAQYTEKLRSLGGVAHFSLLPTKAATQSSVVIRNPRVEPGVLEGITTVFSNPLVISKHRLVEEEGPDLEILYIP